MAAKKTTEPAQPKGEPAGQQQEHVEPVPITQVDQPVDNPWDRTYRAGEAPPEVQRTPQQPAEQGHVGQRMDPTPRDDYTVAGQIRAMNEAADAAKKES